MKMWWTILPPVLAVLYLSRTGQSQTTDLHVALPTTSTSTSASSTGPGLNSTDVLLVSPTPRLDRFHVRLREEAWVVPLMVLSSLNICVIGFFEVFVLYKACGTNPSRRHLFLGQVLLLGLFLCSAMGFAFVSTPHKVTCAIRRLGMGVAFCLVFATLLVKCVFLMSLHSGVYLPPCYQGLLLFFAMAVQVGISAQWLVQRPPDVTDSKTSQVQCKTEFLELIFSLMYVIFLILLVTVLSIRARRLRENHRESFFIGLASGASVILWLAWILTSLASQRSYQDPCCAFGIVCTATVIFLVMFLPKGRQLAAMGREGHYNEDRDMLSSSSPSVYTPSFLHLKPAPLPFAKQPIYKPMTKAVNSAERLYYLPPPPLRVWRYGYSSYPPHHHLPAPGPPHEENYWPLERSIACNPNVKFFRGPLY